MVITFYINVMKLLCGKPGKCHLIMSQNKEQLPGKSQLPAGNFARTSILPYLKLNLLRVVIFPLMTGGRIWAPFATRLHSLVPTCPVQLKFSLQK